MRVQNAWSAATCVVAAFCFLVLALLAGEFGELAPALERLALLLATAGITLIVILLGGSRRPSVGGATVLAWGVLAIRPIGGWAIPLYLLWAVFAFRCLSRDAGSHSPRPVHGLIALGAMYVLLSASPELSHLLAESSAALTGWVTQPIGGGALGTSASGLTWLLGCLLALAGGGPYRSRSRVGAVVLILLGLWLAHTAIQSGITLLWMRDLAKTCYIVLSIPVLLSAFAHRGSSGRQARLRHVVGVGLPAILLAIFVVGSAAWSTAPGVTPMDVCFLELDMLGSWQTPADTPYGGAFSGASFGLLPKYLEAYGHRTRVVDRVEREAISNTDLVVIINPGRTLETDERDALFAFVKTGGALVVMGDHTNVGGVMDFVNAIVEPVGLGLRFDSAVAARHKWVNALRLAPPLDALYRPEDVQVSIGASVWSRPSLLAAPLLVGEAAFSDPGDPTNTEHALLDNLEHDRGERYGELALAIGRPYGKGRIILFGDTSGFQNVSLADSAPYVASLLEWIADGPPAWSGLCRTLLVAALILSAPIALRALRERGALLIVLALLVATGVAGWTAAARLRLPLPVDAGFAFVDLSHGQHVSTEPLGGESLDGLIVSLARTGYLPLLVKRGSLPPIGASDLYVSVAATSPLGRHEITRLERGIADGARAIVATGWPTADDAWPWLESLGLSIRNIPLGLIRPDALPLESRPQMGAAWPLELSEEWLPVASVTMEGQAFVVGAERPLGLGSLVVLGDIDILLTESLETKGTYVPENLEFVRYLLTRGEG